MEKINCLQCKYFVTTWDKDAPRGCSIYKIKTASFPSFVVKRESGTECMSYVQKEHFKKAKKEDDLNNDKYW